MLPYFELEIKLPEKLVLIEIEEAIEVLQSFNKNIDGTLSDFSESEKSNLVDYMEQNYIFNVSIKKLSYSTDEVWPL